MSGHLASVPAMATTTPNPRETPANREPVLSGEPVTVNSHPVETGCYVGGWHGQYCADITADLAESFGLTVDRNSDPRRARRVADYCERRYYLTDSATWATRWANLRDTAWEWQHEAADAVTELLRDATSGASWEWDDGLNLIPTHADDCQCWECV